MSDSELLAQYVRDADQTAFAELARRYVDLVYAAAVHHLNGDRTLAEDVAQQVFIDLARKGRTLLRHECLGGWLFTSARFAAVNAIRQHRRRARREQEVSTMNDTTADTTEWGRVRPVIDDALDELSVRDRQFVILRFFGQQSFADIARQFSVTENAAQKAVDRALDRLGAALSRRGIASTAGALTVALSQAGVAAPAGLQVASLAAIAGVSATATNLASIAAMKWAIAALSIGVAAGVVGYRVGEKRQLTVDTLARQQEAATHAAQVQQLNERIRGESARASNAEADTTALLGAIASAQEERAKAEATQPKPLAIAVPTRPGTAYAVQPRDTFPKIAQAYGITVDQLAAANPDVDARRMRVGQLITLPPGAALRQLSARP